MGALLNSKCRTVSYGGILIDQRNRILLRGVTGQFDGYVWTFPKGLPTSNEEPEAAALREVREETGYSARIIGRLPGEYIGGTGVTIYFLMAPLGKLGQFDKETSSVRWVSFAEARHLIKLTYNVKGRRRDLQVLEHAINRYSVSGGKPGMTKLKIPAGLEFSLIDNFDARCSYKRCTSPGMGVSFGRNPSALADFWWDKADHLVVRFTSQGYRYSYKFWLKSGNKLSDRFIEGRFSNFVHGLLIIWMVEAVDIPPLDYLEG